MSYQRVICYRVDLHYIGVQEEVTRHDVIIPRDMLDSIIDDEINDCDIIIKERTIIYLPNEC